MAQYSFSHSCLEDTTQECRIHLTVRFASTAKVLQNLRVHLLSNADVKGPVWESGLKAVHPCAAAHGCMDAHHSAVLLSLCYESISKVVRVGASLQMQATNQTAATKDC